MTATVGSWVCCQVKVFQRPGRAVGLLQSLELRLLRMPISALAVLQHGLQGAHTGLCTAESGLTPKGSSNCIKNSQGPQGQPFCRTPSSSLPPWLPTPACLVPSAKDLGSLTRGSAVAQAPVGQVQFCNCHSEKLWCGRGPKVLTKMRLEGGCYLCTGFPISYRGIYPRHRENKSSGDFLAAYALRWSDAQESDSTSVDGHALSRLHDLEGVQTWGFSDPRRTGRGESGGPTCYRRWR